VPCPDFETSRVQTFLAGLTGRIAFPFHFVIADGAHGIILEQGKVIRIFNIEIGVLIDLLIIMLLLFFFFDCFVFELNESLELRIEIGRCIELN
jgi:hypothetical protein